MREKVIFVFNFVRNLRLKTFIFIRYEATGAVLNGAAYGLLYFVGTFLLCDISSDSDINALYDRLTVFIYRKYRLKKTITNRILQMTFRISENKSHNRELSFYLPDRNSIKEINKAFCPQKYYNDVTLKSLLANDCFYK